MISQQTNGNQPGGVKELRKISKEVASSERASMPPESNSGYIKDGAVPNFPFPFNKSRTSLLKVKHSRHPVVLKGDDELAKIHPVRIATHVENTPATMRAFIGGLSHCYNNLLMGIWGHASLIGMILEKSDPFQVWLAELEDLIQNGSNLIHLLFGFIAERRSAARKLRFQQLITELKVYHKDCGLENDFSVIEDCICEISHISTRVQMSASVARVVDRMQFLLLQKRSLIDEKMFFSAKASAHLGKMDALIERGSRLIMKLQYYAGIRIPVKKSICLRSMVQRKVKDALHGKSVLHLKSTDKVPLPRIDADRYQIDFALDLLLENAIQATGESDKVEIELNTLYSEAPQDRCGVHMLKDYAVLTIRDTGKGMETSFQSKIFEPFFTGIKGQGRSGLGLPAAAGIIRAHGGYIQVRSKSGQGSAFKIYLPVK